MSCAIIINPNTTNNNPRIDLYNTSSYQYFISNYNNSFFDLGTQTTGDIILNTNNVDQMHILNSNGYIGINNSSPAYILDVVGSARFSNGIISGKSIIGNVISAGVNWQIANTGYTSQTWVSICYGNGMFVAVGAQFAINNIMTSTDGINWTLQTKSDILALTDVCYGNGMFVTVGNNYNTTNISSVATSSSGAIIAAATNTGNILVSTNTGLSWTSYASSQAWSGISMSSTGTIMAACINGGNIWVSINTGVSWTSYASSQAWSGISMNSSGTTMAACVNGGFIWVSTNTGVSWTQVASSLAWSKISVSSNGLTMAACVNVGYIWVSSNTGSTWTQVASSLAWTGISTYVLGSIIACVSGGQVWYSVNNGTTWTAYGTASSWTSAIANNSNSLVAGNGNGVWSMNTSFAYVANTGTFNLTNTPTGNHNTICISEDGKNIVVTGTGGAGLSYSTNYGVTWASVTTTITSSIYHMEGGAMTSDCSIVVISGFTSNGSSTYVYISYYPFTSWNPISGFTFSGGPYYRSCSISDDGQIIVTSYGTNVYVSTNRGSTVFQMTQSGCTFEYSYLSLDGTTIVVVSPGGFIYYATGPFTVSSTLTKINSSPSGKGWANVTCSNTNSNGTSGATIFATEYTTNYCYYSDYPYTTWTIVGGAVISSPQYFAKTLSCSADGNNVVAGAGTKTYISSRPFTSWTINNAASYGVLMSKDGTKILGCGQGTALYKNYTASFALSQVNTTTNNISAITSSSTGSNIYVSTSANIGFSTNSGSSFSFSTLYLNSNFYYSLDTVNWTLTKSSNIYGFCSGICYGNNTFVVMVNTNATQSLCYYSYDGVNWYASNTFNNFNTQWTSLCYGNQIFVAVGGSGTNGNNIAYSYDGKLWSISTTQNTTGFYQNSICYANGNFAICDQAQNIYACNFPSSNTFVSSNVQSPYSIAFDSYGYMYVGNQGYSGSIGPVSQFNATTGAVVNANFVTSANISNSNNVWNIAIDSANNLYICADGTSGSTTSIYKGTIASNGTIGAISVFINTNLSGARYCGFDNLGNFFVSNYNSYAPYVNKYIMTTPGTIGTTITSYIPNSSGNITGIAFDSTNNMYLSNYNTNTILKYTNTGTTIGSTGTLLATITLSNTYNNGIAIDSGNNIYVSFYGTGGNTASSGTLTKYDPNGNLIYTVAGGLNYPGGMTINRGNIYLAISTGTGQTTGSIAKITQLTLSNTFNNISSGLASPFGTAIDSNGFIYVANENATTTNGVAGVIQYYPNGTIKNSNFVPAISSAENKLWGIAIDAYNNLYILNGLINAVYKFSINSNGNITNSNYQFITTGLSTPQSCAIDNSGNLYVSNWNGGNGYINKYVLSNGQITSKTQNYISGTGNTWQIAFDSANNLYFANLGTTIYKYSSTGTLVSSSFISGLSAPMGLAIDSLGNFYVSSYAASGNVKKFPSTGGATPTATLVSNINSPAQLTINNGYLYIAISTGTTQNTGSTLRYPVTANNTLAYGNGTYVSFNQGSNYMLYSNDISNNIWKSTTVPTDVYRGIAYGNGEFVTIGQTSGNVLLSGLIANSAPPNLNITYNNVYVNNSITLYDNSDPTRSKTGLQSYDTTNSANTLWSLVYSSNNLVFTSYDDFIFKVNSINSLASNGTNALYIKSDGNVSIGKGSTTANYKLDISGNVYLNALTIFGPNNTFNVNNSTGVYALTASDGLTDASLNTLESTLLTYGIVNIVRPDNLNRSHLALNQYNSTASQMYTWQIGYVYNGIYTSNLGIFGPANPFSQTAVPSISFYNNNLLNYYPFDSDASNYATGAPVADTTLTGGATITNSAGKYNVGSGALYLNNPAYTNGQYLKINSSITTTINGLTISCWYNVQYGAYGWARIFDFGNGAGSDNIGYGFGNGPFVFQGSGSLQPNISYITVDTNWHLFTWTLTYAPVGSATSIWNIYCDAVLVYTTTTNWYPNTSISRTLNYIGNSNWGASDGFPNGYIDDFRIYNSVLSSSEVSKLYSNKYTLYPTLSSVGINTKSTLYTLDVSGTGKFSSTLTSGNLVCNSLSVSNINQWYITRDISGLYTLPPSATTTNPGNIGSTGFGNVYVKGYATASSWNFSTATFTAPSNGIYMFQLNVFDISANSQNSTQNRILLMIGTGMTKYNSAYSFEYLMFSQSYNTIIGSYTVTRTVYLNSGETIYYNQIQAVQYPGYIFAPLYWVYGDGYTNLTITQLC